MNIPQTISLLFVATVAAFCAAVPAVAENAKPKNITLIDFTSQDIERTGADTKVQQRYGWASGDWNKNIVYVPGRGLLVNFVSGKGNMGGDKSMKLGDLDYAYLIVVIGNRNEGKLITAKLIDADGTEAGWYFPLEGKPRGVALACRMPLSSPDKVETPGKVAGLDKNRIRKWQVTGDWQEAKLEVLLVKLGATN